MVTLGGIIGSALATNKAFATLPLSMMVATCVALVLVRKDPLLGREAIANRG